MIHLRRLVRGALPAAVLAGSGEAPLLAQRGAPEIRAYAGLACFVDEAWCDVPHAAAGVSGSLYFSRSWAFVPEFLYARGAHDYDLLLVPSLAADLGRHAIARPYATFGFGLLRHQGRVLSGTSWTFHGGFGVKIFVAPRVYVAPEVRFGWEPFFRIGAGIGYVFGK
jgi:hypothetical protein